MKKKSFWVCLLLLTALLFGCTTPGNEGASTVGKQETLPVEQNAGILLASNGVACFEIIIPEDCDGSVIDAANDLKEALRSKVGAVFMVSDDYTRGGVITNGENEIVIGNCKRTASQNALEGLTYSDYSVSVSGTNIVVAGYENAKLVQGVEELIAALDDTTLVKTETEVRLLWNADINRLYNAYPFSSISLGETSLFQYRIVYPSDVRSQEYLQAAFDIQESIGTRCGYVLEIVSDATEEQACEILIGKTNRAESESCYAGDSGVKHLEYGFSVVGQKILVACGGNFSVSYAAELFEDCLKQLNTQDGQVNTLSATKASLTKDETIPTCVGDYRFMSYNILVETEGWGSGGIIPSSVDVRKEIVAGLLLRYLPDVVGIQEMSEKWSNELPDEIKDIYTVVETKRPNGTINAVPLLYNKNRLTLIDSASVNMGEKVGHITWGLFEDKETSERFVYMSTHWDPRDEALRMEEAQITADLVVDLRARFGVPIFSTGDFNSGKNSEQCALYMQESGLILLSYSTGVDHIFGETGVEVVAGGIERANCAQYASDHKPVWVDITMPNK